MQLKLRNKKVAVEKIKKTTKKDNALFTMPETEEYCGVIKYLGSDVQSDLLVGQTVYFGTNFQEVRMAGSQLCVMDDINVLAVSDEEPKNEA